MGDSILSKKHKNIGIEEFFSRLQPELLMKILDTYATSDLTDKKYNSLKISSKIMKFCMISKNIFNIVKNNIQYYLNPNQYFYCNYMFKSKFPKETFEEYRTSLISLKLKYIVFKNEVFNGTIEFPEYEGYIKTKPIEKKLHFSEFEKIKDYRLYIKEWNNKYSLKKYPVKSLSYFERVDFVNCKFNNCQIEKCCNPVTLFFLNCDIENTSNKSHMCDERRFLDFHEGNVLMKSCKIVNSLFEFTNTSNILLKDNILLYEECDELIFLDITNLQKELIIERNTFHIGNKNENVGGDMMKIINHKSDKYYSAEIFINYNIIKIFHSEIQSYFCPIILFNFEFSKFSKLIINANIYYDCIKNEYSIRPIGFNTENDELENIKSDFDMRIGISKAYLKTSWLCPMDNSLNEDEYTHNNVIERLSELASIYNFKFGHFDYNITEILEYKDMMYLKDSSDVIALKLRSHYSENDIIKRVLNYINTEYKLSNIEERYALWI